ncbi:hypothetical protein [Macrococcoides caseolyticum]|uniref:hypothetical protein n=1 Tax=Macrococcoides caseolyticum TaxID=69966 RepID=UPI0005A28A2B|nr:hypothetical protein [Macrococcus caseolyticus]
MENSLSILTRLLRKENFEFWIVENSDMLNYVTKIFIWREKKILNVLTVTSASKETFLTFEDLIVQIESLVSDLNTKLEVRNLYEFLAFNETDYSEYWDYDEDGEVFVSKREQIESDLIEFIKKNLTDKYSFDYPNLVDETKDYSW